MAFSTTAKCVLVIGATSGIGRDLALAIHALPSKPQVIVAGRRQERLNEILDKGFKAGKDNLHAIKVDMNSGSASLNSFVKELLSSYPELDAVIFAAGIQYRVDFTKPAEGELNLFQTEFNTNYTAVLTLITYLLPRFLELSESGRPTFLLPVTSGLAFVPNPAVYNYCATKAALHSLAISLRVQLRSTKVNVIEIMPPLVESELHDHQGVTPLLAKFWMPLSEFTPQVMEALERGDEEIPIGTAAKTYEKFEKGKQEMAEAFLRR